MDTKAQREAEEFDSAREKHDRNLTVSYFTSLFLFYFKIFKLMVAFYDGIGLGYGQ